MAENTQDDILEESTEQETAETPKGLTHSLLVKIAIGLAVLLIALLASFFFLSQSADTEMALSEDRQSEMAVETEDSAEMTEQPDAASQNETIELPVMAETAEASAADATLAAATALAATTPVNNPNQKILAEIIALQQQILNLQKENQGLIKKVEQLTQENQTLKASPEKTMATTQDDDIINDARLVNSDNVPAYSRQHRYAGTPQPQLAPKWGEFDTLNSAGQ